MPHMLGENCQTPKYFRQVIINNNSGHSLTAKASYKSGASDEKNIDQGSSANIHRDTEEDGASFVDAIVNLEIWGPQNNMVLNVKEEQAEGVEIREYDIGNGFAVQRKK